MTDPDQAVVELGWAIARQRAVERRQRCEGNTPGALQAAREAGAEYGAAIGRVYRLFGADDEAFEEARRVADVVDAAFALSRVLYGGIRA